MPPRPPRSADRPYLRTGPVMGTVASVQVHDDVEPEVVAAAVDRLFGELERLEQIFSTFRPTSDISRINRGELELGAASPEVAEVLDACTWLEHGSGGAFTVRPPDRPDHIDPAGFVKGWAAERSTRMLSGAGLADWSVNVGGDVQTSGRPGPGATWTIGVADPVRRDALLAAVPLPAGGAVATSGTAERGDHLWSRAERDPALLAVTVTGPQLTWADAYATTVFALGGEAGLDWLARFPEYQGFAVWADHRVEHTAGFAGILFGVSE